MEQSLLQKLQRIKINDIAHIFLFLLALPIALVYRRFRKNLWLICDNRNEARDNGYYFFRYMRLHHPEQDVMYAINKKSPDYARVKDLGEVVQYGSFKHWIYYLTAAQNISSQKEGKPNAAVCYVLEVYGLLKNTRIFLQHGITKDDMQFLYYKRTRMRLFICAVEDEFEYVKERFGYPDGWVQKLGFCRYDSLVNTTGKQKQILVMPTWRNWIGTRTSKSYEYENIDDFTETNYYKAWNGFLKNEKLRALLKRENIRLVFYPHRQMQPFLKYFHLDHPNITVACWPDYDVQELLKESDLLITDYSSIAMDFAYLKKPLLYYQFDYEMFRKGHYAEGYFDYKRDGFGKVCKDIEELLKQLVETVDKGEFMQPEEYTRRVERFFAGCDHQNCERTYQTLLRLK